MKYKPEWRGRLRVDNHGNVYWDGVEKGRVVSFHQEGAKSPGGMVTNTVFRVADREGFGRELPSMTQAIEFLLPSPSGVC